MTVLCFFIILAQDGNDTSDSCSDPNFDSDTLSYGYLGSLLSDGTYSLGTIIHVTCLRNYQLYGQKSLVCQEGGHWSSIPECIPDDDGKFTHIDSE